MKLWHGQGRSKNMSSRLWQAHERLRFPCAEFTFDEKWLRNEASHWKQRALCPRGRRRMSFSYLFLSVMTLSVPVSFREHRYPGEKTSHFLAKKGCSFPPSSWQTREFRYGPSKKEHNAHCALSMYQRFAPSSAASSSKRTQSPSLWLSSLNVTKNALILSAKYKIVFSVSYGLNVNPILYNDFDTVSSFQRNASRSVQMITPYSSRYNFLYISFCHFLFLYFTLYVFRFSSTMV